MLDLSKELSALWGIPRWKWERLKACVDAQFEKKEKENVLEMDKDVLRERLVSVDELELNAWIKDGEKMDIFEFHRRMRKYCERKEQETGNTGTVDCAKVCKMVGYCYRAQSAMSDEIVQEVVALLESESDAPPA